jgi:hypothetical protein
MVNFKKIERRYKWLFLKQVCLDQLRFSTELVILINVQTIIILLKVMYGDLFLKRYIQTGTMYIYHPQKEHYDL